MWMIIGYGIQFVSIFLLIGVNSSLNEISRKLDRIIGPAEPDNAPPSGGRVEVER